MSTNQFENLKISQFENEHSIYPLSRSKRLSGYIVFKFSSFQIYNFFSFIFKFSIFQIFKFLLFLFPSYLLAQEGDSTVLNFQNGVFKHGESLRYEVRYGILKGGEATMWIALVPAGNTFVYKVAAQATTAGVTAKLVSINDIYESYIDIVTGLPIKSIRNINEQNYRAYDEVLFLRKKNLVQSMKYGIKSVPDNTLDILSAFYYARRFIFSHELKMDEVINLTTFFDGEIFPIKIKYKGIERVKCKIGKIECLRFVPVIAENSPIKREDDLSIWVSNDKNYIPVKIRFELPVGSLKADLIGYKGLKNKLAGAIDDE